MEKKRSRKLSRPQFSFVGYPDDLGVKNVNGRLGAKAGPEHFRIHFDKLRGKWPLQERRHIEAIVEIGEDLERNYARAVDATRDIIQTLDLTRDALLVVGGGHDNAYPWIKSLRQSFPKKMRMGCINLDAHFDLREWSPLMTSGSPFRRLIDEGYLDARNLIEFGIQEHCNGPELWEYAKSKKIKIVPFEKLRNGQAVRSFKHELKLLRTRCDVILISLDLDALSYAFCPGVSSPQAEGFTASEVFQMLECAGSDKKVTSLGIFELSPELDLHDLTSRFAAQSAWHFLNAKLS